MQTCAEGIDREAGECPLSYRRAMPSLISRSPGRFSVVGSALLALALTTAGCVSTNQPDPEACAAPTTTLELSLTSAGLTPRDPAVCRGQQVELQVQSNVDGILHFHGYEEQVPLIEVVAGERADVTFDASRSGQFPIEVHTNEAPEGTSVGILTVYEP